MIHVLKVLGISLVLIVSNQSVTAQSEGEKATPNNPMRLMLGSSLSLSSQDDSHYFMYGGANYVPLSDDPSAKWANGINVLLQGYQNSDNTTNQNNEADRLPNWFASGSITVQNTFPLGKQKKNWTLLVDVGPEFRMYPKLNSHQFGGALRTNLTLRDNTPFLFFSSLDYGIAFSSKPIVFNNNKSAITNFGLFEFYIRLPLF